MNRHESSLARVARGIAAVAMTAVTIAVAVVVPAKVESDSHEPLTVTASKVTPAVTDAVTGPLIINVVGVRGHRLSVVPVRIVAPEAQPT